jgi:hypothetical protein
VALMFCPILNLEKHVDLRKEAEKTPDSSL